MGKHLLTHVLLLSWVWRREQKMFHSIHLPIGDDGPGILPGCIFPGQINLPVRQVRLLQVVRWLFIAVLLFIASHGFCQYKSTVVRGYIEGLGSDTMTVSVSDFSYQTILEKKIPVRNGGFRCSFIISSFSRISMRSNRMAIDRPGGGSFFMRSKDIFFFAAPGDDIRLQGKLDTYALSYTLQGNELSGQAALFRQMNLPVLTRETISYLELLRLKTENAAKARIDSVDRVYAAAKDEYNLARLNYVKHYPEQQISADFLLLQEKDTILRYFELLGPKAWATFQGQQLRQMVNGWQKIRPGADLVDFTGNGPDNQPIKLSDHRGKYLLIDFWGSWCGPCIAELPDLMKIYDRHRGKLDVLGVAISDNRENLKKAIAKYNLPWKNILNNEADPLQDLSLLFNIQAVPAKFLVSPEGKFIGPVIAEDESLEVVLERMINK